MLEITVLLLLIFPKGYITFTQEGSMYDKFSQCSIYTNESAILTSSFGTPVTTQDTSSINTRLILNNFFLETLSHFATEKTIPRIVHDRGTGAFGYFKVTNDLSDICKAKVFDTVGKITPVTVRFSLGGETDSSDLLRENRGFAVKFYTEEGNYDQLGLTFDVFPLKDPILFPSFTHTSAENPHTNLDNENSRWDFHTLAPESLQFTLRLFGDQGIPDGYRHMPMHTIHTFELTNHSGKRTFARFFYTPHLGIKTLTTAQAKTIQGEDLDYATRDLYNAIAVGNYPTWTLNVQTIKEDEIHKIPFDIFDVTQRWPIHMFNLRTVGTLELNENPKNHFAEIQQLAFSPGNLAPGVRGLDTVFEARVLVYKLTQTNRLGNNLNKIRVNCPLRTASGTYLRDGPPPVGLNGGDAPNYFPNSYTGPRPTMVNDNEPPRLSVYTDPAPNNFNQAHDLYSNMTKGEKTRLVQNIVTSLKQTTSLMRKKAIELYNIIDPDLSKQIKNGLKEHS